MSSDGFEALWPAGVADALAAYTAERPQPPGRPYVLANFVAGLDGAVAVDGRVGPLTSAADQRLFHELRSLADVVLVGAGTVRTERYGPARVTDEQRKERLARGQSPVPPIAVVSGSLRFDWGARFFRVAEARPIVVTSRAADAGRVEEASRHAEVAQAGDEAVDVVELMRLLYERGARVVLCEGGPTLLDELVAARLLDELCLTLAPMTGGDPLRLVAGEQASPLTGYKLVQVTRHGDELYLRYRTGGDVDG